MGSRGAPPPGPATPATEHPNQRKPSTAAARRMPHAVPDPPWVAGPPLGPGLQRLHRNPPEQERRADEVQPARHHRAQPQPDEDRDQHEQGAEAYIAEAAIGGEGET